MSAAPSLGLRDEIGVRWLVSLRWLLLACALVLVAAVELQSGDLPLVELLALIALAGALNVAVARRARRDPAPGQLVVGGVVLFDVAALTGILALTGGVHNPFAVLYLFEVVVAALVLPPGWVAGVCAAGGLAYGSLFLRTPHVHDPNVLQRHLVGMWIAYGVAAPFVAMAIHRLRGALAEADRAVERARRTERLASLATLAAGAAHEIANPLSTIAVVAGELVRSADAGVADDGRLVQREVARCREVLDQLAAATGSATGEAPRRSRVGALIEAVRPGVDAVRGAEHGELEVFAPVGLLAQALRRVVDNAREAGGPVELTVERAGDELRLGVSDQGVGMTEGELARAGEPFYTTKARGMGLGLHFVRSVVEHNGGRLELRSRPGAGTTVTLILPVAA